jgi:hypothetical protein
MSVLFVRNVDVLQCLSVIRADLGDVARNGIAAGFFTTSGWTPERAGLTSGYSELLNLYTMKENYHTVANEEFYFHPGGKKYLGTDIFSFFPLIEEKLNKHDLM